VADRKAVSERAQLLHAAAGPRGDAACDLHGLALVWHFGRADRWLTVRSAGCRDHPSICVALCQFRGSGDHFNDLYRYQSSGSDYRGRSTSSGLKTRIAGPELLGHCRPFVRRDFFLSLPYPLIVFIAALYGFACLPRAVEPDVEIAAPNHSALSTVVTVATWLAIWWVPLFLVASFAGQPILVEIGTFFSKLAVVTFGGAYAVLAYMGQDVVGQFGWLSAVEMVDALGLAETTPGPLILVTEFVGFMATFRDGGLALGLAGALVTLWVTFTPCFLWIFAGAPYIDAISARQRLSGALSAITAAVVGVIANLSIWFSLHVFFDEVSLNQLGWLTVWQPDVTSINVPTVILAALCGYLLLVRHWSVLKVILTSALLGVGLSYVGI
jgi:chromate transporter